MQNNRYRLIELLEEAKIKAQDTIGSMNKGFGAWYADYLLEHGAIVPQCKVGDVVYFINVCTTAEGFGEKYISFGRVDEILINEEMKIYLHVLTSPYLKYGHGKFISVQDAFMSKEAAEKALDDMQKEDYGK